VLDRVASEVCNSIEAVVFRMEMSRRASLTTGEVRLMARILDEAERYSSQSLWSWTDAGFIAERFTASANAGVIAMQGVA